MIVMLHRMSSCCVHQAARLASPAVSKPLSLLPVTPAICHKCLKGVAFCLLVALPIEVKTQTHLHPSIEIKVLLPICGKPDSISPVRASLLTESAMSSEVCSKLESHGGSLETTEYQSHVCQMI